MMRFDSTPSSIALRVCSGRQSMAVRRSRAGRRREIPELLGSSRPEASDEWRLAVRLGLNVGYWGLGMTASAQLELVREAESAGFDSVWAAEAYGSDAATVLAWLAAQTSRIRIGSAIFQMPARSPAMTAMTAATLDQQIGRASCRE